jgi:hypothetical protein
LSPGEYRRQALPLRKLNNAIAHLVGVGARLDENGVGTILSDLNLGGDGWQESSRPELWAVGSVDLRGRSLLQ